MVCIEVVLKSVKTNKTQNIHYQKDKHALRLECRLITPQSVIVGTGKEVDICSAIMIQYQSKNRILVFRIIFSSSINFLTNGKITFFSTHCIYPHLTYWL
jgi:hypothetical protein